MGEEDSSEAIFGSFCHVLVLQQIQEYPYLAGPPPNRHPFPICQQACFCLLTRHCAPRQGHQVKAGPRGP